MLSKQVGCPYSWGRVGRRQLSLREAVGVRGAHEREIRGYSVHPCVPTQGPEHPGWWWASGGKVLETLSKLAGDLARQMPGSGPGTGPGGLWASAMPLFMHEGPLTCTGPERGTLLGPSVHAGTGNLQAAGSLLGWRSPSALMASVAAGLAGWWWAWLARCRWGCPFLLCPRATLGDAPNKGRHRGNGVWLGMTGALVRRTGKLRWGQPGSVL